MILPLSVFAILFLVYMFMMICMFTYTCIYVWLWILIGVSLLIWGSVSHERQTVLTLGLHRAASCKIYFSGSTSTRVVVIHFTWSPFINSVTRIYDLNLCIYAVECGHEWQSWDVLWQNTSTTFYRMSSVYVSFWFNFDIVLLYL